MSIQKNLPTVEIFFILLIHAFPKIFYQIGLRDIRLLKLHE